MVIEFCIEVRPGQRDTRYEQMEQVQVALFEESVSSKQITTT